MLYSRTIHSPLVEDLFRQIVAFVGDEPPNTQPTDDERKEEVVFELNVEGVRYTLTRTYLVPATGLPGLSPREKEIVRLVAKGMANKAIAAVLDVSPWTVATHLRRVYSKLGVSSRAEMIARVMAARLLVSEGD